MTTIYRHPSEHDIGNIAVRRCASGHAEVIYIAADDTPDLGACPACAAMVALVLAVKSGLKEARK